MTSETPETKKKFRCQYKTVGLTYSRCGLEKEEVLEALQSLFELECYYIVRETHKEESADTPYHIHAWIKLINKPNANEKSFDIISLKNDKIYHPNIGKKNKSWIHNYLKKQDKEPLTDIPMGFVQLAQDGMLKEAREAFINLYPKDYIVNLDRIERNLKHLGKRKREDHVYPLTGDTEVEGWDPKEKSLVIVDLPRMGKTEWAKSWITHHLKETYLKATHLDSLKKYDGQDWIIYDDMCFKHLPLNTQKHIAETKNARDIHCRNTTADIPPGVKQIFCCNEYPFSDHDAVRERIVLGENIKYFAPFAP